MGDTKHEVLPGTLNLLILKTLATLASCTVTASPAVSNRSAAICSNSIKALSIPHC